MNYNHLYHAGCIADIIKHLTVIHIIKYCQQKNTPLLLVDTHSAQGVYNLNSIEALKTGEFTQGIDKFENIINKLLPEFSDITNNACLFTGEDRTYPGSAFIMQHLMRENDKCIFVEKNPKIYPELKRLETKNVFTHNKNGYEVLNAVIPDIKIKRGIVLIDPPFENKSEFDDILNCLKKVIPKFSGATYIIWYPIKDKAMLKNFYQDMKKLCNDFAILEFKFNKTSTGINAIDRSGLYVVNPTWHLKDFWKQIMDAFNLEYKIIAGDK